MMLSGSRFDIKLHGSRLSIQKTNIFPSCFICYSCWGDYNLENLNKKEKESLDTIMVPYGMDITNNNIPTIISGNCKPLLDYIITDLPELKRSYKSDTPLRTIQGKMSDHFAKSIITEIKMHKPPNVRLNEIFDKTDRVEELRSFISNSNRSLFYNQTYAGECLRFSRIF